jgi:hypothetical protein
MKDLPHHMKKLNRRIIRSEHRLEMEGLLEGEENMPAQVPQVERPKEQLRKQEKSGMRKETRSQTQNPPTEDARNREMKKRVPIFDPMSHQPKQSTKPKKKAPPI